MSQHGAETGFRFGIFNYYSENVFLKFLFSVVEEVGFKPTCVKFIKKHHLYLLMEQIKVHN